MTMSQGQYNEMQKMIDELKSKSKLEIDRLTFELSDVKESSKQEVEDLDSSLKEKEEEIKNMKNKFEKEVAIFN